MSAKATNLGALVTIAAKGRVHVTRPDGSTAVILSDGKEAFYVLDKPGKHTFEPEGGTALEVVAK